MPSRTSQTFARRYLGPYARPFQIGLTCVALLVACGQQNHQSAVPAQGNARSLDPLPGPKTKPESSLKAESKTPSEPPPTFASRPVPHCSEHDTYRVMRSTTPASWLPDNLQAGLCDMDDQGLLVSEHIATEHLISDTPEGPMYLSYLGPMSVSLHFTVGVSLPTNRGRRGFCFFTTQVGLRVANRSFHGSKLGPDLRSLTPWFLDVDGDGIDELLIRESAFIRTSVRTIALTVTAYDRRGNDLVLDARSTKMLRSKMAAVYDTAASAADNAGHSDSGDEYRAAAEHLRKEICIVRP